MKHSCAVSKACRLIGASCALLLFVGNVHAAGMVAQVASGLDTPIYVTAAPGDPNRLFILEQGTIDNNTNTRTAEIKILDRTSGTINSTPFLTLTGLATGNEQGLTGMTFAPDYATSGRFYLDYQTAGGASGAGVLHVDRFTVSPDPNIANTTPESILSLDKSTSVHNGGWIGFSPRPGDGNNLYIAVGDNGSRNDPDGNAQNTNVLFGKILRVDVSGNGDGYTVPATNPFGNEVFAFGLRNPFRDSFDSATGKLFIGDVGQDNYEEIDVQSSLNGGENYGWRAREGTHHNPNLADADPPGAIDPILDYPHTFGKTVIGGYVYHGPLVLPNSVPLEGKYIFGDFLGGSDPANAGSRIFMTNTDGTGLTDITSMLFSGSGFTLSNVYSFGEDANGNLYIVDGPGGAVYALVPEPATWILALFGAATMAWLGCRRKEAGQPT